MGAQSLELLPLIIYLHQQLCSASSLAISLYLELDEAKSSPAVDNATDIEQAIANWHQYGLTQESSPIANICKELINNQMLMIKGIQPLVGLGSQQLSVQLHIGELSDALKQTPAQQLSLFSNWLISSTALNRLYQSQLYQSQLSQTKNNLSLLWQIARLSQDNARVVSLGNDIAPTCRSAFSQVGLAIVPLASEILNMQAANTANSQLSDPIIIQERNALRFEAAEQHGHCQGKSILAQPAEPSQTTQNKQNTQTSQNPQSSNNPPGIAIIGGGLASCALALSLTQKGQSLHFFCQDSELAQRASGNKQGAIYPLLTPENNTLSQFYQQAFLYSRRLIEYLAQEGHQIGYDFCGVLHTGHDDRSSKRIDKIIQGQAWPRQIARPVSAVEANDLANLEVNQQGIFYPLGGWVCPHEFAKAAFAQASISGLVHSHFNTHITRISQKDGLWYLHQTGSANDNSDDNADDESDEKCFGPFKKLVLANGEGINRFEQTRALQISGFRGQVSHIPAQAKLSKLATVLCSIGYLTPANQGLHCVGASYVKLGTNQSANQLDYCPQEQLDNADKMHQSYPNSDWLNDIDISANSARVGVRMVTRDHAPMVGLAPNIDSLKTLYLDKSKQTACNESKPGRSQKKPSGLFWQHTTPPSYDGLYLLGGLGSRGLSSGPLAAEALARIICNQQSCIDYHTLSLLSPNRMWLRKLIKGKAVKF